MIIPVTEKIPVTEISVTEKIPVAERILATEKNPAIGIIPVIIPVAGTTDAEMTARKSVASRGGILGRIIPITAVMTPTIAMILTAAMTLITATIPVVVKRNKYGALSMKKVRSFHSADFCLHY